MSLIWSLIFTVAAQPRDAVRVQAGEDLVAWRALQEESAPAELRRFIADFPSSPLAEVAYRRLLEQEAERAALPSNARLAASYARHEEALQRQPAHVAVAELPVDTLSEPSTRDLLSPIAEGGVGLGPGVYVGAGAALGGVSLTARAQIEERPDLSASLRYAPARWSWRPLLELRFDALEVQTAGALGVRRDLSEGYALEIAGGAGWDFTEATWSPELRLGIVYRI